jgi:hypothetical protein
MSIVSFGGIPTKIDVDRIAAHCGVPNEGATIILQDVANAVGMDVGSNRFRTVMNAWRKQLFREHNLLTVGDGQGGVRVADPAERIKWSASRIASGRRCIGRAVAVASTTDKARLSKDERKAQDSIIALNTTRLRLASGVMR